VGLFDDVVRGIGGFIGKNAPAAINLWNNKINFDRQREFARSVQFDPLAGERGFGGGTVLAPIVIQQPQQATRQAPQQFQGSGSPPVQIAPSQLPFLPSPFQGPAFTSPADAGGFQLANLSLPGGAPVVGPNVIQRGMNSLLGLGGGAGVFCDQVFTQGPTTVRAARTVIVQNPASGKLHWYRNMGRPVLWSGDIATCKRVDKIARKARSARRRPR